VKFKFIVEFHNGFIHETVMQDVVGEIAYCIAAALKSYEAVHGRNGGGMIKNTRLEEIEDE
jgi:hypothetical protein